MTPELILLCAIALDAVIGDPRRCPHPVRWIARFARKMEKTTWSPFGSDRVAGIRTAVTIILATAFLTWLVCFTAAALHPVLGDLVSVLILSTTLAARDLAEHAWAVFAPLAKGDLTRAKNRLSWIVSRDVAALKADGVVRSTVESVAENTVDGLIAPLFFAVIAGPVGAMTYKAINTLDSLFGYKTEKYREFGWASAKIDDVANWIPARIAGGCMVVAACLLRLDAANALRVMLCFGQNHPSPNSGICEAATAGALRLRLAGPNMYFGTPVAKPWIGDDTTAPVPSHIQQAIVLMLATYGICAITLILTHLIFRIGFGG